ncbi:MAG: c-type cytochrome [Actinomycetota bacterium]
MSRTRSIEIAVGLIAGFAIVVALGVAILSEPARIDAAGGEILATQVDDAMDLYAEQCSVCHGLNGEGIGSNPPLDSEALRTVDFDTLFKTIERGRFGTAMPAWSIDDGGPFSDYQVGELVALVQHGDWAEVGDRVVNLGFAPLVPFTAEPDPEIYESVGLLPSGESMQRGIDVYAAECVACHGEDGLGTGLAPALNDPLVGEQTVDEISRTIDLGVPGTLMAPWGGQLDDETISDLAELITRWDEVPLGAIPAPDVPIATTEESLELGETLYAENCSQCHGVDGQGTQRIPALNVQGFLEATPDAAIEQIVTLGVAGTPMPAWGDRMTEAEIQSIVGFIRSWEDTAPAVATPSPPPGRGGPPWMRADQVAVDQSEPTDWRIVALIASLLILSIALVGAGLASFRRHSED